MVAFRPLVATTLALLTLATPAFAMGQRPAQTPAEQAASIAEAALNDARHGEMEKALKALLDVATTTLANLPVDPQAACTIAAAQRACVHEAATHSARGRWLNVSTRAFTHAVATQRRLGQSLMLQARTTNRPGKEAYWAVSYEVMEAWLDLFPEIPLQDPSFELDPGLAARERAMPRDRYRPEALALFKALRANIQTDAEARAFRTSYRQAVDTVRAAHPVTLRLNDMFAELQGWVDGLPVVPQ